MLKTNKKAVISIIIAFIYLFITIIYIVSRFAFTAIESQSVHWYEVKSDNKPIACMLSIENLPDKTIATVLFKVNLASPAGIKVIERGKSTLATMHETGNYCGSNAKDETTFVLPINTLAAYQKIAVSLLDIFYLSLSTIFYWFVWKFYIKKKKNNLSK